MSTLTYSRPYSVTAVTPHDEARRAKEALKRDGFVYATHHTYCGSSTRWEKRDGAGFFSITAKLWHAEILPVDDFDPGYEAEGDTIAGLASVLRESDGREVLITFYGGREVRYRNINTKK